MSNSPPITVEEVRALREALGVGGMGSTAVSRADTGVDGPCWNVRLIGLWSSLARAEARARMASAAPSLCDLVLEQAAEIERARSDERSKIAERLRERAAECEGSAVPLRPEFANEWWRAARVLREMASSLISPEETGR